MPILRSRNAECTHALRDLLDRQTVIEVIRRDGRIGHQGHRGVCRMLSESRAAMLLDRPQAGGAVRTPTTENDADDPLPVSLGGGREQRVGCGTGVVDPRPLAQSGAVGLQKHVMVRRRHVDVPGFD